MHAMFPLTPKIPKSTKRKSSYACQSWLYVTWKRTILPVPNGLRNLSVAAAIIAQKKLLHITLGGKKYEISSSEKSVPPTGAPKATATPAAPAALKTSLRFASFVSYFLKNRLTMFPIQLTMCTKGPSLPRDNPLATDIARPTDLANRTRPPRYP